MQRICLCGIYFLGIFSIFYVFFWYFCLFPFNFSPFQTPLSDSSFDIAGSAGDPNAPQLIVENRAVQLEYAKDLAEKRKEFRGGKDDRRGGEGKTDWLCEAVSKSIYIVFLFYYNYYLIVWLS